MPNFRLGIVDGTGDWNDDDYARGMEHSFCHQSFEQVGEPAAKYMRGPSNDGLSVRSKAHEIADWISAGRGPGGQTSGVYLMGYSRGASAVVYAAELLQARQIDVDGLFLFDAVARHVWSELGGTTIPANVRLAVHAARDQDPGQVRKYEGTINGGLGNPLRPWFGGVAIKSLGPRLVYQTFSGSHGALGGVGWTHVETDPDCQKAVATFMNGYMQQALGVSLDYFPPTGEPSTGRAAKVIGAVDRFAMAPGQAVKSGYEAVVNRLR